MTETSAKPAIASEASRVSYFSKPNMIASCGVFIIALAIYTWTLAPTVTLVDSGELILAARTLGVAHPPGFPLYVMLAHLASLIPIGNIAQRVNFASALFAALSAAVVCLAVIEAFSTPSESQQSKPDSRKRKGSTDESKTDANATTASPGVSPTLTGIAAGLLIAASRTLWSYATIAEVYTLNSLLIALSIFCMFRWRRLILENRHSNQRQASQSTAVDRMLNVAALCFGLGLGVHHVTVGLMLPAFAALVLCTEGVKFFLSKRLAVAAVWAFGGLAIYAYLPLAASRSPLMNWGNPDSLSRFISHVTGWQYQVFFEAKPERIGRELEEFARLTLREFGPPWLPLTIIFAALGLYYIRRKANGLFWFLVLAIGANLAYNVNYEIAEDKDAYYLPVFISIAIAAGAGLSFTAARLLSRVSIRRRELTASAVILCLVLISFSFNLQFDNRKHYFIARDYLENVLASVEPAGMLLTLDWQVYSPMLYLREVEKYRSDVVAIDVNQLRRSWYFDYLEHSYPETMARSRQQVTDFLEDLRHWEVDPDLYQRDASLNQRISSRFQDLILSLVENQISHAKVYVTQDVATYRAGRDSSWAEQIAKKYQLVPQGLIFVLYNDGYFHTPDLPPLLTRGLNDGSLQFEPDDVVKLKVLPVYTGMLYNRGRYLAAAKRHDEAIASFRQALSFDPGFQPAERAIVESQVALRKSTSP